MSISIRINLFKSRYRNAYAMMKKCKFGICFDYLVTIYCIINFCSKKNKLIYEKLHVYYARIYSFETGALCKQKKKAKCQSYFQPLFKKNTE